MAKKAKKTLVLMMAFVMFIMQTATPAMAQEAPEIEAPVVTIEVTAKQVKAVEKPVEKKAEAPAEKAEAPAEKAEAPAEKAEAPAEKAEAPAEKTEAPAEKAEAPAEASKPAEASPAASRAAESITETVVGEDTTTVTTTTTTTSAVGGNETEIVEKHEHTTTNDPENPVQLEREETTTTSTTTDPEGEVIKSSEVIEGSQTTVTQEADNGDEEGQVKVTVPLTPGETTVAEGTTTVVTGEKPDDESKGNYKYTETKTVERTVEATAQENEIKVETSGKGEYFPIQTDRDMIEVAENQLHTDWRTSYKSYVDPNNLTQKPEEGGYDFLLVGQGQMSDFYVGCKNDNKVHSGALQLELLHDPQVEDGKFTNDMEKDRFTTYCVDLTTSAQSTGYWYKMDDLEDADYYDEESASYIRTIVTKGYWGTDPGEDKDDPALGSLEKLKQEMKAVADELGLTEEQIDSITAGQALAATQAAIWMHSNDETRGKEVDTDGRLVIDGFNKGVAPDPVTEEVYANAEAVFNYLLGLEPTTREEAGADTIIDEDSFLKENSMSITVGDKTKGHANNSDDDNDNDVYDVDINFALVVTTDEDDDLIVQVVQLDSQGNAFVAAQGRIAGNGENDKGFNEVTFNEETGEYSLTGMSLAENADFDFDLKLTGTQHLQEGVYIFTSEVRGNTPSQTLVGIAEGEKEVNISQNFVINFEVDENNTITEVKKWRSEKSYRKPNSPERPGITVVVTHKDPPTPGDPGIEIPDGEVPLAGVPQTGDMSGVYAMMSLVSLCGIILLMKKRAAE